MPNNKNATRTFTRLLRDAPEPIYALDQKLRMVYCNQACAEWLNVSVDEIVGREVRYTPGGHTAAPGNVAGLCPPPEAMQGNPVSAQVSCMSATGKLLHRRAFFLPLGESSLDCIGVVVFVESEDRSARSEQQSLLPAADSLHSEIRRFYAEQSSRHTADRLLGDSPAIRQVRLQVKLAASSGAMAFVWGPQGSGCEHVARSIYYGRAHSHASRMVPIDCETADTDILRSTLSTSSHASSRTTFLLLRLEKLERAAQEELYRALAGSMGEDQFLSCSTRSVESLLAEGLFSEEILRMLSTIEIRLPPLVERMEDLPLLAQYFLEQENQQQAKQLSGFRQNALEQLATHRWPNNIEELAEVVRETYRNATGPSAEVKDLPERIRHGYHAAVYLHKEVPRIDLQEYLAQIERELIRRAMRKSGQNKTKAAELLNMQRARFYRRLEQLGLEEQQNEP